MNAARRRPLALLVLLAVGGATACRRETAAPLVVLVSVDTLRADRLGVYGHARPTSPRLDELSASAVLFAEAYASSSSTLPSHATLLTSSWPQHHGAEHTARRALPGVAVTLAETFSAAGWRTVATVAGGQLAPVWGLDQGFEVYDSRADEGAPGAFLERVHAALARLDEAPARPTLLLLHSYETHHPYRPAAATWQAVGGLGAAPRIEVDLLHAMSYLGRGWSPAEAATVALAYDAEIRSADAAFGELLDGLARRGRLEGAIVVFTSDHGEELGEHGRMGWHSHTLHEELLRVPLLVRLPGGRRGGSTVEGPVRLIDVAPTLVELAGLATPPTFDGRSLVPELEGRERPALPTVLWRETRPEENGTKQGIRSGALKLVEGRLYDLAADPLELRDVAAERPAEVARLSAELRELLARRPRLAGAEVAPDPETQRQLRALGYL